MIPTILKMNSEVPHCSWLASGSSGLFGCCSGFPVKGPAVGGTVGLVGGEASLAQQTRSCCTGRRARLLVHVVNRRLMWLWG